MIIILDISQRVLGQSLSTERKYLSIMNSTTSHEMRNPLNAIISNIDKQEHLNRQLIEICGNKDFSDQERH